jgi:Ca2+-transporting ATPase
MPAPCLPPLSAAGPNSLPPKPKTSVLARVRGELDDQLVRILLGVAALSAAFSYLELREAAGAAGAKGGGKLLGVFVEPLVILLILVVNAALSIYMSAAAEASLSSLADLNPATCTVLRGSVLTPDFPTSRLLPGDVVHLKTGDRVPADCRLLSLTGGRLGADEAALTGEADTVDKTLSPPDVADPVLQQQRNVLFGGTCVTAGGCAALVTATGALTEIGKIQASVMEAAAEAPPTPLQLKLDAFAGKLTKIVGGICVACFVASSPKFGDAAFDGKVWK